MTGKEGISIKQLDHISVIGAGNIGTGLAILFSINGYDVTVVGVNTQDLERSKMISSGYFDTLAEEGLMTKSQICTSMNLIKYTTSYLDIAHTDFVYESVFESPEVKWSVYHQVEQNCPNVIAIASTTSAITPDILARGMTKYQDRIVVAHPCNPPHMVPLVEMLACDNTEEEVVDDVKNLLESVGRKVVLLQKNAAGFLVNRLQYAMYREAVSMVEQGIASPEDIDKSLIYGFAPRYTSIDIFEHFDYGGLDLSKSIEDRIFSHLCTVQSTSKSIEELCAKGDLGAKSGKGFYEWDEAREKAFRKRTSAPYFSHLTHTGGVRIK